MESVTYFLARDFQEAGNLLYSGLFDLNWQPKLRLLAYAASTDAMRGRKLVGMADPALGLEAYILEKESEEADGPRYTIVCWALDRVEQGMHSAQKPHRISVFGWRAVSKIVSWRLDPVALNPDGSIIIPNEPLAVYADELPDWKLLTPEEWRARKAAVAVQGQDAVSCRDRHFPTDDECKRPAPPWRGGAGGDFLKGSNSEPHDEADIAESVEKIVIVPNFVKTTCSCQP